ncbi:hypothetical protein [Methylobacterium radiotolerans]|uniref:hypothetical protein n=1 Tax=Methylobacterium radiotolerans TaxID=31998 RepID=UPI0015F3FAF9|nr:hypothetical protein [Methylobacterium radiotolerans]
MPGSARGYFLPAVVISNFDDFVDKFYNGAEDILDQYDFEDVKMRECLDLAADSMRAEYALAPSAIHITREATDSLLEDIEILGQNSTDNMFSRKISREDASISLEVLFNYLAVARRNLSKYRDEYDQLYALHASAEELEIPTEKAAPVKVSIINDRLTLVNTKTNIGSLALDANDRIRESLRQIVQSALENLGENHNVDPRFAPAWGPFLGHLSVSLQELSIEGLGINWQIASDLLSHYKEELPIAVFLQLDRALKSTNILLSQYDEWRAYLGAEAVTGLSQQDLSAALAETETIADDLAQNAEQVDPNVAKRFREIINPAAQRLVSLDTIATPLIGSLSNVFGQLAFVVLRDNPWVLSVATEVGSLVEKGVKNTLVLFAMAFIIKYAPKLSDLAPFKFLRDTYDLIVKKYPWMKDTILK